VVPRIVTAFNLAIPSWTIRFANIASDNALYNAFKAWYGARFFGSNINPNTTVSCNVYLVMIWLAQKRPVQYTANNVFEAYRAEAEKRWQTYNCAAWSNVTEANLPK
jgi:hypothetical protein